MGMADINRPMLFSILLKMFLLRELIMKITGYYNESGYQIESDNLADAYLYQAGNHRLDSYQDGTGTEFQLSLDEIKSMCEQTGKDIAVEKNAEFVGVEYLEPAEI